MYPPSNIQLLFRMAVVILCQLVFFIENTDIAFQVIITVYTCSMVSKINISKIEAQRDSQMTK